jgi:putative tricarboxylic transport membrane protein
MTVRSAELLMAIALAILSVAFMLKSTEGLSIWWVPDQGPGSGVWPFWLSLMMLVSCLVIALRWFMGLSPQSRSHEPFMDADAVRIIGTTIAALFLLILCTYFIGIYFSLALFLLFYLKVMGRDSWTLTVIMMLSTPVLIFFFFEYALTIPLPKGEWIPDEVYDPLYRIMYGY